MKLIITKNQLKRIVEQEEENKGQVIVFYLNIDFFIKKCPFDYLEKMKMEYTEDGFPIPTTKEKFIERFFSDYSVTLFNKTNEKFIRSGKIGDIGYIAPDGVIYSFASGGMYEVKKESIKKIEDFTHAHQDIKNFGYDMWSKKNIIDVNIVYTDLKTDEKKAVKF